MIDYRGDVATIIEDWDILVTQKRATISYNNRGDETPTWTTVTTAYVDIQALPLKKESYTKEEGVVKIYSHRIFGCYDVSNSVLSVIRNDRFYVSSTVFYEVEQVVEHDNAHLEIYCNLVTGRV